MAAVGGIPAGIHGVPEPLGSGVAAPPPGGAVASGQPTPGQVKAAVADANQSLAQNGTQLTFVFDDQLHETLVKIVDIQTHEVVGQIPSEAMLAAARALAGSPSSGALLNTKV